MWNPFEKRRLKRDWRLVSTLEHVISWVDENGKSTGDEDKIYYYLSENGLGERKCEHNGSGKIEGSSYYARNLRENRELYVGRIVPWEKGRYDPKIPSYESIKAKEMKDKLAGRIT